MENIKHWKCVFVVSKCYHQITMECFKYQRIQEQIKIYIFMTNLMHDVIDQCHTANYFQVDNIFLAKHYYNCENLIAKY